MKALYTRNGVVTNQGQLAFSFNDVLRFSIYQRLEVSTINEICLGISQNAKLEKKIAFGVFRETED